MRLLRLLIAAAVLAGAAVLLKRLLEEEAAEPEPVTPTPPAPASRGASEASTSRASGEDRPAASGSPRSDNGGEPTKAELYERAQELGIEGRSRMSKQELRRAIEAAG